MTDDRSFAALNMWLHQRKQQSEYRQLLVVMNTAEQHTQIVASIQDHYANSLLVSDQQNALGIQRVSFSTINLKLGAAYSAVIIDCTSGFQANVLYACAGLVLKGGLLVLLTSNMSDWSNYYAQHRGIKFSFQDAHTYSYFAQMLKNTFERSACLAWCADSDYNLPILNTTKPPKSEISNEETQDNKSLIILTDEQNVVAQAICESWGTQKSIHVISAERGRGKTTLLAQLALHGRDTALARIVICTPSKAQSDSFFNYYAALGGHEDEYLKPVFLPADQFSRIRDNDLVLVDEMASIAPSLLSEICDRAGHIILAGTLDGYEGSGRGMLIRWLPKYGKTLTFHHLNIAFRWRTDDHLDYLIRTTLSPRLAEASLSANDPLNLVEITKQMLLSNAGLYTACFGLLMNAHYQSTANDIQRMLDSCDHRIWGYINAKKQVIGVICTIDEGGIKRFADDTLRHAISYGERRVHGHMSSQALSQAFNNQKLLLLRLCRVHRIAVSPNYQKRGIGSAMLKALHQQEDSLDVDGFTTSFGINATLDHFWHNNGYDIVKVGQRKDTSSGALTGHYLRTSSNELEELTQLGQVGIYTDLLYLRNFQPNLYELICDRIKYFEKMPNIKDDAYEFSCKKAMNFVHNKLSFTMVRSHVYYIACFLQSTQLHQLIAKQHTQHLSKHEKLANIELIRQSLDEVLN